MGARRIVHFIARDNSYTQEETTVSLNQIVTG